jgi:hypothetical protein
MSPCGLSALVFRYGLFTQADVVMVSIYMPVFSVPLSDISIPASCGATPLLRRLSKVLVGYVGDLLNRDMLRWAKRAEPFHRISNSEIAHLVWAWNGEAIRHRRCVRREVPKPCDIAQPEQIPALAILMDIVAAEENAGRTYCSFLCSHCQGRRRQHRSADECSHGFSIQKKLLGWLAAGGANKPDPARC